MSTAISVAGPLFVLSCWGGVAWADVAVIAHKSVPEDTLSKNQLLSYFEGDVEKWNDGVLIVVVDLKARGEVRETFYRFLGKRPSRMKSIWLKKMLSGEGDPPKSMNSEEEMLKKVALTPGAIGFVSQARASEEVKTLILIPAEDD